MYQKLYESYYKGTFLNYLQQHKQIPLSIVIFLLVITIFIILVFGLTPKNFSFTNDVSRILGSPGIKFGNKGIAYTEPFFEATKSTILANNGLSFEIALKPDSQKEGGFRFIIVFHDGKDTDQLLVGQWKTHIIVMNGDDYSNKRKMKRISANTAALSTEDFYITVTSGKEGTKIYFNGELIREKEDLTLKIPNKEMKARLIMGNSVYGNNSWEGTIYGLAFYQYELTSQKVYHHYDQWLKNKNFTFAIKENPYLLYLFNENNKLKSLDYSGHKNHIYMPERMKKLERKFLSLPNSAELSEWLVQDILINFFGFVPFGFILSTVLMKLNNVSGKYYILITVLFGFLLSLIIEYSQSWIPTRDSNLLDLTLNTLGALVGAAIYKPSLHFAKLRLGFLLPDSP